MTYTMTFSFAPDPPQAEAPTEVSYLPRTATGDVVTELDVAHEKLSHLIIVSEDLSFFDHVHADPRPDGSFALSYTFLTGGPYVLFADFVPRATSEQQVFRHETHVAGEAPVPVALAPTLRRTDVEELSITLLTPPEKLRAGVPTILTFAVEDETGQPVSVLEPYLGAGGHAVIISEDTEEFLHSHPVLPGEEHGEHSHGPAHPAGMEHAPATATGAERRFGPELSFHTVFPRPGRHKAWVQFQRAGKGYTAAFVMDVV